MTKLANAHRGEAEIRVGDSTFLLRPSFENLVAAEEEIGSLFALVERAGEGALTIKEVSALIWHCLPRDDRPAREMVAAAIMAMGLMKATVPVRNILTQVLQGEA